MGRIAKWLAAAALLLAGLPGQAQEKNPFSTEGWWKPAEPPFSPAVHDDASITFRLRAPRAHEVTLLLGEWEVSEIPMQRNGNGVWSVTVGPLEPCVYQYIFRIDGFETIDPENPAVKAGTTTTAASWRSPVPENRRFDEDIPPRRGNTHPELPVQTLGVVRRNIAGLRPRAASSPEKFPVLYLRHGGGDNENSWVTDGRAATILDNLIAENKAVPMYVVMTNGLTDGSGPEAAPPRASPHWKRAAGRCHSPGRKALPGTYRQTAPRYRRTVDPGGQAYVIGLRNLDRFCAIGQFSAGILSDGQFDYERMCPA